MGTGPPAMRCYRVWVGGEPSEKIMLDKFKQIFGGESLAKDSSGKATERDVVIAIGVLLLEMAGADEDYAPEETQAIFDIMEKNFKLTKDEALEILEAADAVRRDGRKLDEFVSAINEAFDAKQKERIFAGVWKVVLADGRVDKFEQRFATQLRFRLELTDEQLERAKHLAETNKV